MDDELGLALHHRDHERDNKWSWGRDYGKDILTDINMVAHAGADCITRDCLQRAYREIARLRASTHKDSRPAPDLHGLQRD